ncbi:fused MFS/spermidine synthase [Fodinicola feengrottensis]
MDVTEVASGTAEQPGPAVMVRWWAITLVMVSAAAVLILELTSVRLAAPYVGNTFQTYTASIAVTLAAIALGANRGGWAADFLPPKVLIGPLLAVGGLLVLASKPIVLAVGPLVRDSGPAGSIILVGVAAAAPVAVLSAISPVVVKTQLRRLADSGTVVGRFSAFGTVGGLAGTFLTGYVLLATLPVSAILVGTGAVLVALGGWQLVGSRWLTGRRTVIGMVAVLVLATGGAVALPVPCDYETAYYCARVTDDSDRPGGRTLWLDDAEHSYVDTEDYGYLKFAYTQRYGDVINAMWPARKPVRALHIGGGGFTMPRWLTATRPGSTSRVLEVDPVVVRLGRERLGLRTSDALQVRVGDARVSIRSEPAAGYDLVIGDAFSSSAVPWHLATQEFAAELRRVLRPGGLYVLNVIDFPPLALLAAEIATVRSVFGAVTVMGTKAALEGKEGGNFVIVAGDRIPDRDTLLAAAAHRGEPGGVASPAQLAALVGNARPLTDDRAPVDQLITTYRYF